MTSISKRTWGTGSGKSTAWLVSYADQSGERHRKQFQTKAEAEIFKTEVDSELMTGTFRQAALKRTVSEAAVDYVEHIEGRYAEGKISTSYLKMEKSYVKNYIRALGELVPESTGIGNLTLRECSGRQMNEFEKRLRLAGASYNTRQRVLNTLTRVFKRAISQDEMSSNPVNKLVREPEKKSTKVTPPSHKTMETLLAYADGENETMIRLAASTAIRISEQLALLWGDVDFEKGILHIRRSINQWGEIKKTKTIAGTRQIPLADKMLDHLAEFREYASFDHDFDPIFANLHGGHYLYHNFLYKKFYPFMKRISEAEAEEGRTFVRLTWHTLRHYGISTWIEVGMSPKTVQTFAGHEDIKTTMNRYGHLFPSDAHHARMNEVANRTFGF